MGRQEAKASEKKNSRIKGRAAQEWDMFQDLRDPGIMNQKETTNGRLNNTVPLKKRKEAKGRKEAKEPAKENMKDLKRITLYQAFYPRTRDSLQERREEARRIQWIVEMESGSRLVQMLDQAEKEWNQQRKGKGKGERMEKEKHEV